MKVYRSCYLHLLATCLLLLIQETKTKCLPSELSIITKQWYQKKESCDTKCPENMFIFQQSCVVDCPQFTSKYDNGFIKYCFNRALQDLKCAERMCSPIYPFCFNGNCLLSCPEYTVSYNGSCLMDCPEKSPFLTASCDGVCYKGGKICSKSCPSSHPFVFRSPHIQHCLRQCPNYTAINGRFCNLSCPVDRPFLFNGSCLMKCPSSDPLITVSISAFNKNFLCTKMCPDDTASYRNVCVTVCPNGTILDVGSQKKCLEKCGKTRQYIYTSPMERNSIYYRQCFTKCPSWEYSLTVNATNICVKDCPLNFSAHNNTCLRKCPALYPLRYNNMVRGHVTAVCVQTCPNGTFNYNNTCLVQCPKPLVQYTSVCRPECIHPLPFLLQSNRTCTAECPSELLRYNFSCVEKCPGHTLYIENQTCVTRCANLESLSLDTNLGHICVNSQTCDNETILMKDSKLCVRVCTRNTHIILKNVCVNISECLGVYIDTKKGNTCLEKCPTTLYTNGRRCVSRCPPNKMIMDRNCTDKCFGKRPLKMNKNEYSENKDKNVCFSECPKGYVKNENECIGAGRCIEFGKAYTYNNTCYENCPPGTFVKNGIPVKTCVVFNQSTFFLIIIFILLISLSFFFCFAMMCCFKGCTSKATLAKNSENTTETENTILNVETETEGFTNNIDVQHDETDEEIIVV
ncbi:uncharacterized protein LOC111104636 [Crassostrea virginica]